MSADTDRLRGLLGERIPANGTEADTFFTNAQIDDLLQGFATNGNIYWAAVEGWDQKASEYANIVSQTQGGAMREASRLYTFATDRVEHFRQLALGRRATRVGTIRRAGTTLR